MFYRSILSKLRSGWRDPQSQRRRCYAHQGGWTLRRFFVMRPGVPSLTPLRRI